jgi:hypothetical protein
MQNFFKFGRNFVVKLQTTGLLGPGNSDAEEKVENSHQLTYITKKKFPCIIFAAASAPLKGCSSTTLLGSIQRFCYFRINFVTVIRICNTVQN